MQQISILLLCASLGSASSLAIGGTLKEEWYLMRGRANMKIGNMKAAVEAYEKATQLNPDNAETIRDLGLAYASEGLTDKAIQKFDRYLKMNPKDSVILFKQADFLSWKRYQYRRTDAIAFYRSGLAIDDDTSIRKKYARLLGRDKKDYEEAIVEYKKLIAKVPQDQAVRGEYRKLLIWDKKYLQEAIDEYDEYTSKYPKDFEAKHQLARLLASEGSDLPRADSLLAEVSGNRGANYELTLERARIQANTRGREDDAVATYKVLLKQKYSSKVDEELADLLAQRNSTRLEGLEHYRRLVEKDPTSKRLRLKYGRLLLAEGGDAKLAAAEFETVLDSNPDNGEAHRGAALAYSTLGDNDNALYHSRAADKLGAATIDVKSIEGSLSAGRQPKVALRAVSLHQPSSGPYQFDHSALIGSVKADPSPFSTVSAEIGMEKLKGPDESASGALAKVLGEYRLSEEVVIDGSIGYQSVGLPDRRQTASGSLRFPAFEKVVTLKASRDFRYDSYMAFKGDEVDGKPVGGAKIDKYGIEIADAKAEFPWKVFPYTGLVKSGESDANGFIGASGDVRFAYNPSEVPMYGIIYKAEAVHYDEDRSGFGAATSEPLQGGYFSPDSFLNQAVQLFLEDESTGNYFARAAFGPTVQYVTSWETKRKIVLGVQGNVGCYWEKILHEYDLSFDLSYLKLPGINFQVQGSLGATMAL